MADKASYFSRFTAKFVEIVAAGVATAVSGYLVAHLTGYFSASAPSAAVPAAVEVTSHAGGVSGTSAGRPSPLVPAVPAANSAQHSAAVKDGGPSAVRFERSTIGGAQGGAQAAPARERAATDTKAAVTKRRDAEAKRREVVETRRREAVEAKRREAATAKPHEAATVTKRRTTESVEAEVRAALAKVDANRRPSPQTQPHRADIPPAPPRIATQSRPAGATGGAGTATAVGIQPRAAVLPRSAGVMTPAPAQPLPVAAPHSASIGATAPRAADPAPQPTPQATLQSDPTVVIKSLPPVAAVGQTSSPVSQQNASQQASEENTPSRSTGLFSALEKIPGLLRSDPPVPADQAPRPPLPVGQ